jgi:hypothetical protein
LVKLTIVTSIHQQLLRQFPCTKNVSAEKQLVKILVTLTTALQQLHPAEEFE